MSTIQAGKKAISEGRYFTQNETEQWLDQWIEGSAAQARKKKQAIKLAVINTDRNRFTTNHAIEIWGES